MSRRLGARAAAYVREHGVDWREDGVLGVAEALDMPRGVWRTLTRVYGQAATITGGEQGVWRIPASEVQS